MSTGKMNWVLAKHLMLGILLKNGNRNDFFNKYTHCSPYINQNKLKIEIKLKIF